MERPTRHLEEQLGVLSERMLLLGGLVEQAIGRSVEALVERDSGLARRVIADDADVDRVELEIDRICMEILAREQPVARDLRFITTAMKITTDLERMADLAVNVSERVLELNEEPRLKPFVDLPLMARRAQEMVHGSLDAFVQRDAIAARAVIALDDDLDARMEQIFRELLSFMVEDPRSITRALRLTFIAKYFERIGDQATNVCEQVVYMCEGRVIKHPLLAPDRREGPAG